MSKNEQFHELKTEEEIKQRGTEEAKPPKRRIRKESPPPLRPYGKKPWRTIITSFFLLFTGIFFVATGYSRSAEHTWQETLPFFILGTLLLIPGIYHSVIIILIWRGAEGFTYDMLPAMDD